MKHLALSLLAVASCVDDAAPDAYTRLKVLEARVEVQCGDYRLACDHASRDAERRCMQAALAQGRVARLEEQRTIEGGAIETNIWLVDHDVIHYFTRSSGWDKRVFREDVCARTSPIDIVTQGCFVRVDVGCDPVQ